MPVGVVNATSAALGSRGRRPDSKTTFMLALDTLMTHIQYQDVDPTARPSLDNKKTAMEIRLETLGGLRLIADGASVGWIQTQRHRAALLLFLAIERSVTRDRVAALLWPESDSERTRRALNQAVYALRQALGEDVIETRGDLLCISPRLTTDLDEYLAAAARADHATVLAAYKGGFLPSVHLADIKEFEEWVEVQRTKVSRAHRKARRSRLEKLLEAGQVNEALQVAREWVDTEPADDEAQHRVIDLLARTGERTEALRLYELYTRQLADSGLKPLDETFKLMEAIRSGDAASMPAAPVPDRQEQRVTAVPVDAADSFIARIWREAVRRRVPRAAVLYAVIAWMIVQVAATTFPVLLVPDWAIRLVLAAAILGFPVTLFFAWEFDLTPEGIRRTTDAPTPAFNRPLTAKHAYIVAATVVAAMGLRVYAVQARNAIPALDNHSIAVLPFDVRSPSLDDDKAGLSVPELLTLVLAADQRYTLLDMNAATRELALVTKRSDQRPTLRELHKTAERLGAGNLLHGKVLVQSQQVTISASLVSTGSASNGDITTATGHKDSINSVAQRLGIHLLAKRVGMEAQIQQLSRHSPEAAIFYLNGKSLQRAGDHPRAIAAFNKTLDVDSTFAYAALGLWESAVWGRLPRLPRALSILRLHGDALLPRDQQMFKLLDARNPTDRQTRSQQLAAALQDAADKTFARNRFADEQFQYFLRWETRDGARETITRLQGALGADTTIDVLFRLSSAIMGQRNPERDSVKLRQLEAAMDRHAFIGPLVALVRFNVALGRGDTARANQMIRDSAHAFNTHDLIFWGIPGADAVLDDVPSFPRAPGLRPPMAGFPLYYHVQYMTLGARQRSDEMLTHLATSDAFKAAQRMANILFSDGDSTGVRQSVESMPILIKAALEPAEAGISSCVFGQWLATHGDAAEARQYGVQAQHGLDWRAHALCSATIEAMIEARRPNQDQRPALQKLDSVLLAHPISSSEYLSPIITGEYLPATITASRLHERAGEFDVARRAARRRSWNDHGRFTSTMLLLEARNGRRVADRKEEALEAYRHYLTLRVRPESALVAQVDSVRAEYVSLARELGRKPQ
jgi:DNA-binding SARP family transcriptional activator/tetratricopeptide (TPR) repeat protein